MSTTHTFQNTTRTKNVTVLNITATLSLTFRAPKILNMALSLKHQGKVFIDMPRIHSFGDELEFNTANY